MTGFLSVSREFLRGAFPAERFYEMPFLFLTLRGKDICEKKKDLMKRKKPVRKKKKKKK